MSVQSLYSSEMRSQLKVFPVWQPGDPVAVGDIGSLRKGVFEKQTTLRALFPKLQVQIRKTALDRPYRFRSSDCVVTEAQASTTVGGVGKMEATAHFGSRGGVLFDAAGIARSSIDNLLEVRTHVEDNRYEWPKGLMLVASLDVCDHFKLVISEAANALIKLEGSVSAIANLAISDPSVKAGVDGAASYTTHGSGAVAAVLYGFGWFGGFDSQRLELFGEETIAPDAKFEELQAEAYREA